MSLSLFILALWVFLQSAVTLGWFAVSAGLIGFVGIAFVVIVVLEALFYYRSGHFLIQPRP